MIHALAAATLLAVNAASGPAAVDVPQATVQPSLRGSEGWSAAAHVALGWDFTHGRAAGQPSDVAIVSTPTDLFVRFHVVQREPVIATQTVDDAGEGSDDEVFVYLWPSGKSGFFYSFSANPRGTHYQSSSENTTYAPTWTSIGSPTETGYDVTMRIPLRALRADGRATWHAQFERTIQRAGEHDVWSHADGMTNTASVTFAGTLRGMAAAAQAARTTPRVGLYGLAEAGGARTGGSTSRSGADVSLPVTPTASLVATFHPDFSNVETDQASISPTTFRRSVNEVRPFFAQGANFYDSHSCYGCPGFVRELYTPGIPTPKRGYQLEGKQGQLTFGALDAVGEARIDDAQSLRYDTIDRVHSAGYTRVASERPGLHDVTDFVSYQFDNHHGIIGYANAGRQHGTLVTDAHQGRKDDVGIAYQPRDFFASFSMRTIGAQYDPADGFVAVNDISGYSAQANKTVRWTHGPVESVNLGYFVDRYAGSDGHGTNLYDSNVSGNVFLRSKISAAANVGSSFYRVPGDPSLHAANQVGGRIDYQLNSATQSSFLYNTGRFGDGRLDTWDRMAGFRVARRYTVSVDAYDTVWSGDRGRRVVQWLERGSIAVDVGRRASLTVGVRKIVGANAPFPGQPSVFTNATNLSFGFSARRAHDDLYLVYGDASAASTRPALTLKLVHYLGAEKGT